MRVYFDAFKRAFRAAVAFGFVYAVQYISNSSDPAILGLAPLLMGAGKFLREKLGWKFIPV